MSKTAFGNSTSVLDLNKIEIRPVTAELDDARKINLERNRLPPKSFLSKHKIKPIYLMKRDEEKKKCNKKSLDSKNKCTGKKPFQYKPGVLYKVEFPAPEKIPKCHHYDNLIFDRDLWSREEHISHLAKHKNHAVDWWKKIKVVPRQIPPLTQRICELARPKKRYLLDTWYTHAENLDAQRIDKFRHILHSFDVMTGQEAVKYMRDIRKDEKVRRKYRSKELSKVRRKIEKLQLYDIQKVIYRIFSDMRILLLDHQEYHLDEDMNLLSKQILKLICRLLKVRFPKGPDKNKIKSRVMQNLSDKIAVWLDNFLRVAGFEKGPALPGDEEIQEEGPRQGYSIDDFIEDIEESIIGHEDLQANEGQEESETDPETKLLIQTLIMSLLGITVNQVSDNDENTM